MEPLKGYGGRFVLRCWRGARDAPEEIVADDVAALRVEAGRRVGDYDHLELAAWSFELNDWVRMERFGAG